MVTFFLIFMLANFNLWGKLKVKIHVNEDDQFKLHPRFYKSRQKDRGNINSN